MYFGGGTPTVLEPEQLSDILSTIHGASVFNPEAEITIEANPETVDLAKLKSLLDMGFNRLSLGVQSFDDKALKLLGRPHDGKRALQAFEQARTAGFDNVGVDLIYGIPGQGLRQWQEELEKSVALRPEHISTYSLTYEPGTEFRAWLDSGRIAPCQEDLEADMFLLASECLTAAGYEHYEVSNYAKPGFRSRHNLIYWKCGDYLGFGAGAHSHLKGRRWSNISDWMEYVKRIETGESPVSFQEELTQEQRIFEAVFLGLRMIEGIEIKGFKRKWGLKPQEYKPQLWADLKENGWIEESQGRIYFTAKGMLMADSLLSRLAP